VSQAELGERARALIEATRGAYEPTAANRARVRWRVERARATAARAGGGPRWRRPLVALLAAAGVLGGAGGAAALAWSARRTQPSAPVVPPAETAAPRLTAPVSPARPASELSPPASAAAPRGAAPTTTARATGRGRAPGELSAETALIASAQAATNRDEAARALELLDEYERRFGNGALAEEHAAARVLALCSAGRRAAARAEAARFLARWPRSPQAARVRQACAPEATTP